MHRTEILCPECFKKKLLTEDPEGKKGSEAYCDNCGTEFIVQGKNTVKYK
ncbi:MAG: hypothetical protein ACOCQR_02365 [bacterium]